MLGALCYLVLWIITNTFRRIGWWRWRLEGREHLPPRGTPGMIIAMQHVSWVDIPVIGTVLPYSYRLSWLAKSELFRHPLAAWFFRQMQVIPIRRGQRDLDALRNAEDALRRGAVLLVFPEGTRSHTGELRKGRGGAVRMAMRTGAWIVPVAVIGTEHGMRGTLLRRPVTVRIGQPYTPPPVSGDAFPWDQMDELTEEMMGRIAALLPPERRGHYRLLS